MKEKFELTKKSTIIDFETWGCLSSHTKPPKLLRFNHDSLYLCWLFTPRWIPLSISFRHGVWFFDYKPYIFDSLSQKYLSPELWAIECVQLWKHSKLISSCYLLQNPHRLCSQNPPEISDWGPHLRVDLGLVGRIRFRLLIRCRHIMVHPLRLLWLLAMVPAVSDVVVGCPKLWRKLLKRLVSTLLFLNGILSSMIIMKLYFFKCIIDCSR